VTVSIIVAMTRDLVIGRDNAMPWHLPADLKRFKSLTMGKPIIMGRKTFESLGRILPGRRHIVISRNQDYEAAGAEVVTSLHAALAAAAGADEAFVIGGAEIYREALAHADRIYITMIDAEVGGDVHFPPFDENGWSEVQRIERTPDTENHYPLTFLVLERRARR
jgi:dihydrofolate reductase